MQHHSPGSKAKRFLGLCLLFVLALCGVDRGQGAVAAEPIDGSTQGLLVAFHAGISAPGRAGVLQRWGMEPDPNFRSGHAVRVRIRPQARAAGLNADRALQLLRSDPSVRLVEPDYVVRASAAPNDPRFGQLWALHSTGQSGGQPDADIDWLEAWNLAGAAQSPVVAVLDTGVDYNHPDLRGNILRNGAGAVIGWDFANNDPNPQDDHGHGTHVAGTIAATGNNGIGVIGVCPTARIMPLKFLRDDGAGATSDAIRAIDFAVASGVDIISNSWGGGGFSAFLLEAIERAEAAGILVVAAAGNDGSDNDAHPVYPASYNRFVSNVLSVAASDSHDELAAFSNYGRDSVDIAAPGVGIVSTALGGGYVAMGGTSMAAPHVAGVAALTLARFPELTVSQLKERLLNNADRPASLDSRVPRRRLNAAKAMVDDVTPPGAPVAFTVSHFAASGLLLSWTAAGDDGAVGAASRYELRYSTSPLTSDNFNEATPAQGLPEPAPAGTPQTFLLAHLSPDQSYYVGLRAVDRVGSVSPAVNLGLIRTPRQSQHLTLFSDDVEGPPRFVGKLPWSVTKEQSWSPSRSYSDSPGQPYGFRVDSSLTQNAPVLLNEVVPVLSFRAMTDLEPGFDFLFLEVSADDGSSWLRQEFSLTGAADWSVHQAPLGRYFGQSIRIRFRLVTDEIVNGQGVWLDDIRISGDRLEPGLVASPAAPVGLTAYAVARDRVELTWLDRSDNEAGFRIERRSGPTPYITVGLVGADVTRFSDASPNSNTLYHYRVRAINSGGESPPTAEVEALTPPSPPPPPGSVHADLSESVVTLSWTAAVGAETYRVHRSGAPGGPYVLLGMAATKTGYSDHSAGLGIRYYYVVTSVGPGGESAYSNEVSITPGLVLPTPPTRAKARAKGRRVTVTWKQSTSPDVIQNRIYRSRSAAGPAALIASVRAGEKYQDVRVSALAAYYYRVTAVDAAGHESAPSEQVAVSVRRRPF